MPRKKTEPTISARLPPDYPAFLESLKSRIRQAQTRAMLSVNRELIQLYWDIGRQIVERQEKEGWGKSVVDRLAGDRQKAFPGIRGFSMAELSQAVTEPVEPIPPQAVAGIPWFHNVI